MIGLVAVNIGLPTVFLLVRLLAHAIAPKTYGPAGGYTIYSNLVAGVMYIFGFIIAATLGCTAGSVDLTEGMFRHLVVTGRSRLALYFARIPAGLAIVVPMVAVGFAVVCFVSVYAAPTTFSYNGVNVPAGLSRPALDTWAADHADLVICNFGFSTGPNSKAGPPPNIPCGPNGVAPGAPAPTPAVKAFAVQVANQGYANYADQFRVPPVGLMVRSGLWLELEAAIGFLVGLGLASLLGQRTLAVILMIVLELVLTPIFSHGQLAHLINLQRSVVGVAMAHLEPGALPFVFGNGGGGGPGGNRAGIVPETMTQTIFVVVAWIVVWTALGAWRMAKRDA